MTSLNPSISTSGFSPSVIASVEFGLMMSMDRIVAYRVLTLSPFRYSPIGFLGWLLSLCSYVYMQRRVDPAAKFTSVAHRVRGLDMWSGDGQGCGV